MCECECVRECEGVRETRVGWDKLQEFQESKRCKSRDLILLEEMDTGKLTGVDLNPRGESLEVRSS